MGLVKLLLAYLLAYLLACLSWVSPVLGSGDFGLNTSNRISKGISARFPCKDGKRASQQVRPNVQLTHWVFVQRVDNTDQWVMIHSP